MKLTYSSNSQYYKTPQTSKYLDIYNPIIIDPDVSDTLLSLPFKYQYNPSLLAYDQYNTVELWWVFAVVNCDIISDPIYDMVSGLTIRIPKIERIQKIIGT